MEMRAAYITILLIATGLLILTAGLMALLIGLVLPQDMLTEKAEKNESTEAVPPELEKRNAYRSYGNINDYNWLVSVNFLRYRDIQSSLEFACSGVVIARNKLLTSSGCLKDTFIEEDFKYATIRSHSAYFSSGGYTHSVRFISKAKETLPPPYNELYLLEVKPSFSSKTNIPMLITAQGAQVVMEQMSEGAVLALTGWGGTQVPTEHILKFEPFFVQRWYAKQYINCKGRICSEALKISTACCNEAILVESLADLNQINGRPLVAVRRLGPPLLIGMQTDTYHYSKDGGHVGYFIDFSYLKVVEWLRELLPDLVVQETTRVRQESSPLTLYNKVEFDAYQYHKNVHKTNVKKND